MLSGHYKYKETGTTYQVVQAGFNECSNSQYKYYVPGLTKSRMDKEKASFRHQRASHLSVF